MPFVAPRISQRNLEILLMGVERTCYGSLMVSGERHIGHGYHRVWRSISTVHGEGNVGAVAGRRYKEEVIYDLSVNTPVFRQVMIAFCISYRNNMITQIENAMKI